MAEDLRRLFVQLIKDACERYLADGEYGVLGADNDFEIRSIELVPASQCESVTYSYSIRQEDGTFRNVEKQTTPFAFLVQYWNEYGDSDENPSTFEKTLSYVELMDEVGRLIAAGCGITKACNAMHWLIGDTHD